jgi:DNA-binding NarL/FixJ family response regulator
MEEECLVRAALGKLLESWPECDVIGDAGSTSEALELLDRLEADVVLITLTAGDSQSLEIIGDLAQTTGQLLVLLGENMLPNSAAEIVRLGARGVVRKNKAPDELRRAIQKVHEGREIWLDRESLTTLVTTASRPGNHISSFALLTQREREVAGLVNKGLKNKEVGQRLFISETTVRHHLTTIFNKLEVRSRFELIDHLHRHKLIPKERTLPLDTPVREARRREG